MVYHLIRWGAIGDILFITPVIRYLKKLGHKVVVSVTERGKMLLEHDPNIDELIFTPDATVQDLQSFWNEEIKRVGADKVVNFSESLEVSLLKHPLDPKYNLPKAKRVKEGNINAFDRSFEWAGLDSGLISNEDKLPKLYFTQEEINKVEAFFDIYDGMGWNIEPKKKMIIMWVLSGSGIQKAYPYVMSVMAEMLERYDNLYFLTVGDDFCPLLEMDNFSHPEANRVITRAGKWGVRETILAVNYCQMVIGPETGVIVSSGQFDTPKIGLFSSITANHATKYFKNDYSIEVKGVNCAPCFRLIYQPFQCPMHPTGATLCMGEGIKPQDIVDRIEDIISDHYEGFRCNRQRQLTLEKAV